MSHIEARAAAEGHDHVETGASITAHDFYRRLGYADVRESRTEFGLNYILRKPIQGTLRFGRSSHARERTAMGETCGRCGQRSWCWP